ncbi:MAG: DNA polymerase IV [Candidatus Omnitrophica bacterium]|nr:DNA polymerase IV [Candidatus Omnitrophota bacterium]MCM8831608.1 DNA polymerase IV [Candidatus Omnitrophota bacterium]
MKRNRYIVCVDMDAFFASIEQRDNPSYRGKPLVVGADPKVGRGVVSTCSYEARKYGIKSAMPISKAYQMCPFAIFVKPDMEKYAKVSKQIYEILYTFTPIIERVSIDEAFLDITDSYHLFGSPLRTCQIIKEKIKSQTHLTASLGLAPTKIAAKIASELSKPDGLLEIKSENLLDFLWPLEVEKIWGIGKKTKEILNNIGIKTIGDLAKYDLNKLTLLLGKVAIDFYNLAWGRDESIVKTTEVQKSVSSEVTFKKDTSSFDKIKTILLKLSQDISSKLRANNLKTKTITLKIRLEDFSTFTKSRTLIKATNFIDLIYKEAVKLYMDFNFQNKKIRLIGIKASNLIDAYVIDTIFIDKSDIKRENIHKAIEELNKKFSKEVIGPALSYLEKSYLW